MLEDVVSFCAIGQCIICAVPSATQRPCFVYRCNTKVVESGQIIPLATWIPYPVMLLNELPHDMLLQIVSHLEIAELADLACTSSAFHALVLKHGYPRFLIGVSLCPLLSALVQRSYLRQAGCGDNPICAARSVLPAQDQACILRREALCRYSLSGYIMHTASVEDSACFATVATEISFARHCWIGITHSAFLK